jgi:peptidyl-prolyl cis-trans isomerase A (cyclophilin A)
MNARLSKGLVVALLIWGSTAIANAQDANTPVVTIETDEGAIVVALYRDVAPITVDNFLTYVDSSYYDGGEFFRTVRDDNQPDNPIKIDVIQGRAADGHVNAFPAVAIERTRDTGLHHGDGVISMARSGPDTATSHFFICIGDQPELDFGGKRNPDGQSFAAFGIVIKGMDVVKRIHRRKATAQSLDPPVRIQSIRQME